MRLGKLHITVWEQIALIVLTFAILTSFVVLLRGFYVENTALDAEYGGEIVEGVHGQWSDDYVINPLFSQGVEEDIASLIFDSLLKYDPSSGQIVPHLGRHTLSADKRTYTFTLQDNILWHDGLPLTTRDVEFTYKDILQHPSFPDTYLKNTFADVEIKRLNDKEISFTIPEQRKTFYTNFTLGILPQHHLIGTPVQDLFYAPFNQHPVGSGPFQWEGVTRHHGGQTEVVLQSFSQHFRGIPYLEKYRLRIFESLEQLQIHLPELDAVRPLRSEIVRLVSQDVDIFEEQKLTLPNYFAVFFNLQKDSVAQKELRQALRAAVDTEMIARELDGERVDTPFVELWPQDDVVNVSTERAGELLNGLGYYFSDKRPSLEPDVITTEVVEEELENSTRYLTAPVAQKSFMTTQDKVDLKGNTPEGTHFVKVNNYLLQLFDAESGEFRYTISFEYGNLQEGENRI